MSNDCSGGGTAACSIDPMTPNQVALVESTRSRPLDLDALAVDFYRRAFAADPEVAAMFTSDPEVQRARFAAELQTIVGSIRSTSTTFCTDGRGPRGPPPRLRRPGRALPR